MGKRKKKLHNRKVAEKIYREINRSLLQFIDTQLPEVDTYILIMSDASLTDEGRIGLWVYIREQNETIAHLFISKNTIALDSNETEMIGLAYATTLALNLTELFDIKPQAIVIFTDNASAVGYIDGTKSYVPENYRSYYEIIKTNSLRGNIEIVWVKNTKNEIADALSKKNFVKAFELAQYIDELIHEKEMNIRYRKQE